MQKKKGKHVIALWFILVLILSLLASMVFAAETTEETTISTEE